jgi:hypothetical protein
LPSADLKRNLEGITFEVPPDTPEMPLVGRLVDKNKKCGKIDNYEDINRCGSKNSLF